MIPSAWFRGFQVGGDPAEATSQEWDVECVWGEDPPDDSVKWTALYRRRDVEQLLTEVRDHIMRPRHYDDVQRLDMVERIDLVISAFGSPTDAEVKQ